MLCLIRYCPALLALFLLGCSAPDYQVRIVRPTSANWEKEIRAFESGEKTNSPPSRPIVFVGSSSIRLWKSLASDFPDHAVMNRGFGGSQIIDSVYYADRIVLPYAPRKIFMYAGGNDINAGKKPYQILEDFSLFEATVHALHPKTEIYYISIAPNPARWKQIEQVREANRLVRNFARWKRHVSFIDTHSHMLSEQGTPKEGIFQKDNLHMNEKGYEIWKKVIRPYL